MKWISIFLGLLMGLGLFADSANSPLSEKKELQKQIVNYFVKNKIELESYSAAKHQIFLDFCGSSLAGTQFGNTWGRGKSIPVYDIDGDSTKFSQNELNNIVQIYKMVSEDYAPFDVSVTIDPMKQKSGKCQSVLIGGYFFKISGQPGEWNPTHTAFQSIKGLSRYDSFGKKQEPALVFVEDNGGFFKARIVGNAVSHELGHTLSLNHDGLLLDGQASAYYRLKTPWAPLMGGASSPKITQWCQGGYPGYQLFCVLQNKPLQKKENDVDLIAKRLGYRQDDHGNNAESATVIKWLNNEGFADGLIGRNKDGTADIDYFKIVLPKKGTYKISVGGENEITNLNVSLSIFNSQNQLVGKIIQNEQLTEYRVDNCLVSLSPGEYWLKVEGVGKKGAFDAYGSMGYYQLIVKLNKVK